MIIDIHTHTVPDKIAASTVRALAEVAHIAPQTDASCGDLIRSMKEAGVDLSVILPVATKPAQVEKINTRAAETNEKYKGKLFSLGGIHPLYENWYDELSRVKALGLKGIKIHPVYQGADIDSPAFMNILKRCAELDLFVITHAGDDIGYPGMVHCSPEMCLHVKQEIPDLKLVLAHMGGWQNWDRVKTLLADTDVMIDTAFSVDPVHKLDDHWKDGEPELLAEEEFVQMIHLFGADRVLFGTDCPWANQKEYAELMNSLGLAGDEKRKIMGENAAKLLGL
jgi:predicted TIM-barrel fold metal-dependent hydrolase